MSKNHFTVLILKIGTQDFTDPGLQKIRLTLTGLSLWFCLLKCFKNREHMVRSLVRSGNLLATGNKNR